MSTITPFLWFDSNVEEAVMFLYIDIQKAFVQQIFL